MVLVVACLALVSAALAQTAGVTDGLTERFRQAIEAGDEASLYAVGDETLREFAPDAEILLTQHQMLVVPGTTSADGSVQDNRCLVSTGLTIGALRGYVRVMHVARCLLPQSIPFRFRAAATWLESRQQFTLRENSRTYRYSRCCYLSQLLDQYEYVANQRYAYRLYATTTVQNATGTPAIMWWFNKPGDFYPLYQAPGRGAVPFPSLPYNPRRTSSRSTFNRNCESYYDRMGWPWQDGWENHHIKPVRWGGTDGETNCYRLPPSAHYRFTDWWSNGKFETPVSH